MRHRKTGRKLNRNSSHRKAMFRNMVTSLFKYDKIQTTDAKAKELRILADRMITLAKRGDLHARRQALSVIREKDPASCGGSHAGCQSDDVTRLPGWPYDVQGRSPGHLPSPAQRAQCTTQVVGQKNF